MDVIGSIFPEYSFERKLQLANELRQEYGSETLDSSCPFPSGGTNGVSEKLMPDEVYEELLDFWENELTREEQIALIRVNCVQIKYGLLPTQLFRLICIAEERG